MSIWGGYGGGGGNAPGGGGSMIGANLATGPLLLRGFKGGEFAGVCAGVCAGACAGAWAVAGVRTEKKKLKLYLYQ